MKYILVELLNEETIAYQEVSNGTFTRFTDMQGNTLTHSPVCRVIDPNPLQPSWALLDPIETIQPVSKVISKVDYMNLFTDTELATIYTVAKTNVQLEVWLDKFRVAQDIDLNNPSTILGVQTLEVFGIIAPGRAMEILNA